MSSTVEQQPDLRQAEIIDHNIAAGYVTYIVDRWDGDKDDATVDVVRYIGVWSEGVLEKEDGEAFDPPFWPPRGSYYSYQNKPNDPPPLVWEKIETVKAADQELVRFKNDQEGTLHVPSYSYGGAAKRRAELYQAFLGAIDILAKRPEDQWAWEKVDAWRNYNARLHEK